MPEYERETIEKLIDGKLSWPEVKGIMSAYKDPDRFDKYIAILQDRVPWEDRILLPLGLHLYIVEKEDGERVVRCDCGHEFGDYRENWKLEALIYVRDTEEKLQEVYPPLMHSDPEWIVLREYYCPGCRTQLEVEALPPGYPVVFDFQPDLETFYREWLGREI
ncbi:MAG: acetone carboxylase subunit gamma [Actinobacteria bacterium]|nr:acetone carboxylase subunit gamma [Actinomycetota bacterium]MCG2818847.1 acetone carboxylase subunit gamma [Actinomycetes bacterium]MBU4178937.1 acetone carboxylase subunit gamma [Actinomycetota bacterium]MBU4218661.1 acetone carboxylase subunit gamma [Actinomycetota bacterium]MBU4360184.1 acetone carboxylase subunit gamma [Actinomycetota bacterium]